MAILYTSELKNELDLYKLYKELEWNEFLKLDASQLNQAMRLCW